MQPVKLKPPQVDDRYIALVNNELEQYNSSTIHPYEIHDLMGDTHYTRREEVEQIIERLAVIYRLAGWYVTVYHQEYTTMYGTDKEVYSVTIERFKTEKLD